MNAADERIVRDDPARRHLHDYWLVDALSGEDVAGFATAEAAGAWVQTHREQLRGRVTVITILHPDGCTCAGAPPVNGSGRRRRMRGHP
jgi:hypothetical protein